MLLRTLELKINAHNKFEANANKFQHILQRRISPQGAEHDAKLVCSQKYCIKNK